MFQLIKLQETIADKEMPCDAVQGLFDYFKLLKSNEKYRHVPTLFNVRKMKILPKEKYINIEVVDDETGEMYSMNCKKGVHDYCLKNNIYPSNLIQILKECQQK